MLVKAKWNVKDDTGWHQTGEVFEINGKDFDALNGSVEVIGEGKAEKAEPEVKQEEIPAEVQAEKPRNTRRRKA